MKKILALLILVFATTALFLAAKSLNKSPAKSDEEGDNMAMSDQLPPKSGDRTPTQVPSIITQTGVAAPLIPSRENNPNEKSLPPKVQLLDTILASKNDNDPRLDSDFRNLSEGEKDDFRKHYQEMRAEKLNERGTIIFLLGKNISSAQDIEFLSQVLAEPTCQSMADCQRPDFSAAKGGNVADTGSEADGVSLAYPQIVSIKSIERLLEQEQAPQVLDAAIHALHVGRQSKNTLVSNYSREILQQIGGE